MIIDPDHWPDFEPTVPVLIAEAVLALLRADAPLSAWTKGEIHPVEIDDLRLEGSFNAPAILVSISGIDLKALVGGDHELETTIEIDLVTSFHETRVTDQYLRQRVVDHIRMLILGQTEQGCLEDEAGEQLTEALTRFQRLVTPLKLPGNQMSTQLEVTFTSRVDRQLQFIG